MKKVLLITALFTYASMVNAQEIKKIKATDVVKILDTTNHPLVINLWTTWCGPCVNELRYFEKVVDKFKDQNVELVLISIDYPEDYAKVAPFVAKKGYKVKVYWLDEQETTVIQTVIDRGFEGSIPFSIFSNNATKYRFSHSAQLTENQLKKELEKLVK
ncbi:MAG: TlpA family protein disulfide reductase [Chitinophagaceae bacterium]